MSKKEKEKETVEVMKINDSKFTINIDEKPDQKMVKIKTKKIRSREEKEEKEEESSPQEESSADEKEKKDVPELDYESDEIESKRKCLMIIARYKNSKRFGSWLKTQGFEFNTKALKDKSMDELENMINDIRFCISTKNTNNMYETGATKGVLILENMIRPVYKVDGLSQVLSNDPMYLDLIEELLLERANYVYVKPEYRLLYCVLSSAYIVHTQHTALEKLSQTEEGKKMIRDFANQIQNNECKDMPESQTEKPTKCITTKSSDLPPMFAMRPQSIEKKQMDDKFYERFKGLF